MVVTSGVVLGVAVEVVVSVVVVVVEVDGNVVVILLSSHLGPVCPG